MILICHFIKDFISWSLDSYCFGMSLTTGQNIIKVKGTSSLYWFSIFMSFSRGRDVPCAGIVLSDTWACTIVCESHIMITMKNTYNDNNEK